MTKGPAASPDRLGAATLRHGDRGAESASHGACSASKRLRLGRPICRARPAGKTHAEAANLADERVDGAPVARPGSSCFRDQVIAVTEGRGRLWGLCYPRRAKAEGTDRHRRRVREKTRKTGCVARRRHRRSKAYDGCCIADSRALPSRSRWACGRSRA